MHCGLVMLCLQMTSALRTTPTNDKWYIFVVVFGGVSELQFWHCAGAKSDNVLEFQGIRGWYEVIAVWLVVVPVRSVISVSSAGLSAGTLGYFRK